MEYTIAYREIDAAFLLVCRAAFLKLSAKRSIRNIFATNCIDAPEQVLIRDMKVLIGLMSG
jgi:hypothetical protein